MYIGLRKLQTDRTGPEQEEKMDFLTLAQNRYSERFYSDRPVEEDTLAKILEAGRIAPTACNYQPQKIYVLKSEDALAKAAKLTLTYKAPVVLLVCYDSNVAWTTDKDRFYKPYCVGEQDASIVASSMMYEAESLGVHTLWMRGFDAQSVIEAFELPENIRPVMMLALGYPSERSKPGPLHSKRKELSETVTEL